MRQFPIILLSFIVLIGCRKDKVFEAGDYPDDIGRIIRSNCTTAGCHNSETAYDCENLDMSSWEKMFRGSARNAVVIPYRTDESVLFAAVNNIKAYGNRGLHPMPFFGPDLKPSEIMAIRKWILQGAPDRYGNVKFADDPNRRKIYIANQGCDLITVIDAETQLIMRCIDVGKSAGIDAPHDMFVSPDGQHLYISYFGGTVFQRYVTSTGDFAGEIDLVDYGWHSMAISGNSKIAITTHLSGDGKVSLIDLEKMKLIQKYQGSGLFIYPHGAALNYDGTLAYITSQQGNFIYKVDLTDPNDPSEVKIPLGPGIIPSPISSLKPYEVEYFPGYQRYAVTCQGTNDVRIFNSSNDSLERIIPTVGVPQLMSFSSTKGLLFVTCMEDSANAATMSSVSIIDITTNTLIKSVETGYQPRGLAVDDAGGYVYVANRNISATGWAPHHTQNCSGRNGYITLINLNTLELEKEWIAEVSVDPYSVAIRK